MKSRYAEKLPKDGDFDYEVKYPPTPDSDILLLHYLNTLNSFISKGTTYLSLTTWHRILSSKKLGFDH